MEETRLWKLVRQGASHRAVVIEPTDRTATELLLEQVLTASPEILERGLTIVGRQNNTATGPLDLLGVDADGRLVLFELKRGTLTRDAVAQALDYASYVSSLSDEALNAFVNRNGGQFGAQPFGDFGEWYRNEFARSLSDIGKPRIVLVGIGADEPALRIVNYLAEGGLDIAITTFHAFCDGDQTFLAKQMQSQEATKTSSAGASKPERQAALDRVLEVLSLKTTYEVLAKSIERGLGGAYRWPLEQGYTFSKVAQTSDGPKRRNLIVLYVDPSRRGLVRVYLPLTAGLAVGADRVAAYAARVHKQVVVTPTGYVSFWVEAETLLLPEVLTELCREVAEKTRPDEVGPPETSAEASNRA